MQAARQAYRLLVPLNGQASKCIDLLRYMGRTELWSSGKSNGRIR